MKKPTIVFVGHVCIDHNKVEGTTYTNWGSPALYMTKYLQRAFDIQPTIVATYGADFAQYATDVALYPRTPNADATLVYENIVTNGKRTQYCHHKDTATPPEVTEDLKELLAQADILFLAPLTPIYTPTYITELMASVPRGCLKVLLPQGYLRDINAEGLVQPREFEEAASILPYFDLVILSDEDHPQAITRTHGWKMLSPTTTFVVTQNAQGASIIQKETTIHIPTEAIPNNQIVDSVGCGDVFSAATAYTLYATRDISQAVAEGHQAARRKLLTPNDELGRSA